MAKYEITYNEGDHINKKETLEADSVRDAMLIFLQEKPNAVFEKIEKIEVNK